MELNINIDKYKNLRYNFYNWRCETKYINKLFLSLILALLTALLSQVRFYIPGNSLVPITGQTFAVLIAGVILGKWGGVSQCIYLGFGFMGIPWFANITGSTIGYLFGFIIAAFFIGYITDKKINSRNFLSMLPLMLFATFILIYIPGLTYLYFYMQSIGLSINIVQLLTIAVIPFILGDAIKAIAAASFTKIILPKKS